MQLTALIAFVLTGWGAFAFPTNSHYQVATEASELNLDSFIHWDAESSSDFITYQRPLDWDEAWWRGKKVFDLTVGSISSKQFLNYRRLKLQQNLTDSLEVGIHFYEEGDFEQDRLSLPVELKYNFNSKWAASVYGSPSLYKSEDDAGLSLYYTPTPQWEYRVSGLWGDFSRNERNLGSDEWSEAPFAGTFSILNLPEDEGFWRFEAHNEPRSERTNLGAKVTELAYDSYYLTGKKGRFGTRILYDRAFHTDHAAALTRTRKRSLNQFEYSFIMGPHVVTPGLNLFYREMRSNGEQIIAREILPTVWMRLIPRSYDWGTNTLSVGYDATVFDEQNGSSHDRNLEHRLNLKTAMVFKKAGELSLLFTFDLDRFGSGETWEGGAGQFRMDF